MTVPPTTPRRTPPPAPPPPPMRANNPYVGPRAFKTGETLYGRDREANELLDLLIAERIVLLYSPSGAGKSSLVQAALLPRLRAESFYFRAPIRINTEPPMAVLDTPQFNRYVYSALAALETAKPLFQQMAVTDLAKLSFTDYLKQAPPEGAHISGEVLLFDQFEEILTLNPADREAKAEFFIQVGQALRDRSRWALFIMREDYIAGIEPFIRPIPARLANRYRIDLLQVEAALTAIEQPARATGVDFTEAAAQRLVNDLRRVRVQKPDGTFTDEPGPYIEPVQLQVVCRRLWNHISPEKTQLTETDIDSLGEVDSALADYYAERVLAAAEATQIGERQIRSWINRYLITEHGIRGQVLMRPRQSEGMDNQVIRKLQDAHLIRAEQRRGATWFELAHDRLIQPIRQNNIEWFNRNLQPLQRQAARWERENRAIHLLLSNEALGEAEAWAADNPNEITALEREFLKVCQEARAHELEELGRIEQEIKLEAAQQVADLERARAAAERARAEEQAKAAAAERARAEEQRARAEEQTKATERYRRQSRSLKVTLSIVILLALAVLFSGVWGLNRDTAARQQGETAVVALATADHNATRVAAAQMTATRTFAELEQSEKAARVAQQTAEFNVTQAFLARTTAEAASTAAVDERNLALTAQAEAENQSRIAQSRQLAALSLTNVRNEVQVALLLGVEAYRLAQTDEATQALATALEASVGRTTEPVGTFPFQAEAIYALAFSPDGKWLVSGDGGGNLVWWNPTNQTALRSTKRAHRDVLYTLAFSPDGKLLASGGKDGVIRLWDVETGRSLTPSLVDGTDWVVSLSFSADSQQLAVARLKKTVQIWDVVQRTVLREFSAADGHTDSVWTVAFSPSGRWLASGGADANVRVWDAATGNIFYAPATLHKDLVRAVAWNATSTLLVSASRDKTIRLWEVGSRRPMDAVLTGHTQEVLSLAFSADGRLLASGSGDQTIILWDMRTYRLLTQLRLHTHWVRAVTFSQADNLLASGSFDTSIQLQQVTTPALSDQPIEERACEQAGRNFTESEWSEFFPGETYRLTCAQFDVGSATSDGP